MELGCVFIGDAQQITGLKYLDGEHAGKVYAIVRFRRADGSMAMEPDTLVQLLADHLAAVPEYRAALRLGRHPSRPAFYVTDAGGMINFGDFSRAEFVQGVEAGEKLCGVVPFSDLAANTKRYEEAAAAEQAALAPGVREPWKLTPRRAAAIGAVTLLVLAASCRVISAYWTGAPEFEPIMYDAGSLDTRLQSCATTLGQYRALRRLDRRSADYSLKETAWFLGKVKDGRLSDRQRQTAAELRRKLKEVKNEK